MKELKFMTFALFIENKGISNEVFEAKSAEEKVALLKDHAQGQEAYIKSIEEDVNSKVSKEEITEMKKELETVRSRENKALTEAVSKQGLAITKLLDNMKGGGQGFVQNATSQVKAFIADNIDKITAIKNAGHGFVEMEVKAVGDLTTGSATNPDGIPALMGVQTAPPSNVNFRSVVVDSIVNLFNTNQAVYAYTETTPKDGDYTFVAEGASKPQIDFKVETRYAEPCKIAAHEILTEESVKDIPNLQSIATNFLRAKHDLKRQNGLLFGTGVAPQCKGATVYGRTFVAGGMALAVTNTNFMDVVNACITDIYTTHNYQDEMNYMANVVMINPVDFYTELVSAKDLNGLPLYPMASLMNRVVIGGVSIIPMEDIPAGKIFVADMSKYNVSNYVGYTVRIGFINDQFITNKFTIVGESRFHAYVKKLDEQAFIYDDIATIKTAITKV
mgnify:FL=1|tara:strand:- start:4060 stop:5397 length:1338 start_codon:yes stop_codon:yes gene_type:complete